MLPTGIWKANMNGIEMDLTITSVDTNTGLITGTLPVPPAGSPALPITGFWNEASQIINFTFLTNSKADFVGYLFSNSSNQAGSDMKWTLSGYVIIGPNNASFVVNGFATANSHRSVFGWFAQFTQVI